MARPSPIPATVPIAIAISEIATLKAKPVSSRGAHLITTSSGDSAADPPCAQAGSATRARPVSSQRWAGRRRAAGR